MHLTYPSVNECFMVGALIAVVQFLALLVMGWRIRRRESPAAWTPAVTVIIPCKGTLPERCSNIRSILLQSYKGPIEFLLVAQSREDPAFAEIQQLASEDTAGRVRALASGVKPTTCAGKNADLVHAVAHAATASEVLVFSEDKHWAPAGWLAALISGLSPARVGVASSLPLPFPHGRDAAGLWFSTWYLICVPYFYVCSWVSAASFAIRRRDYEDWKVSEHWLRAVTDDGVMTVLAKRHRKHIAAVPDAVGLIDRRLTPRRIIDITTRYVFCTRLFTPWAWLLSGACVLAKGVILGRALWPAPQPALLALLAVSELGFPAGIAFFSALRFPLWKERWPEQWRPVWVWTALAAPAAWALFLGNYCMSAFSRQTNWAGVRYKARGPYEIKVLD
ncbi:MAG: hypothetical protein WCK75_10100 [Elusimicrobiota bacterium]